MLVLRCACAGQVVLPRARVVLQSQHNQDTHSTCVCVCMGMCSYGNPQESENWLTGSALCQATRDSVVPDEMSGLPHIRVVCLLQMERSLDA